MTTLLAPPPTKVCGVCHEEKPRSEFHRNGAARDGLRYKCKLCTKLGRTNGRTGRQMSQSLNGADTAWMKRYTRLVECGEINRVRLKKRDGIWYVFEIDKDKRPLGAGVPASPFMISLWLEVRCYL